MRIERGGAALWAGRWLGGGLASALFGLVLACALLLLARDACAADSVLPADEVAPGVHAGVAPAPAHLTQAQYWPSNSGAWDPPASLAQSGDAVLAVATPWETVALPHARPRAVATTTAALHASPEVVWYRMQVPAEALAATPGGARLYIPRWQTLGTLGVYGGDGRLLWRSRGTRVWNTFNRPVWIDLASVVQPGQPLTVHVRMASMPGAGGALTSVWAGAAQALMRPWQWRTLLQVDLIAFSRGSYLMIGVFALALWLVRRRREESMYVFFFLMSVFQLLATLHYLIGDEGVGLSDAAFTWLVYVVGALGSSLCSFYFLCTINRTRLPWLGWALTIYVTAAVLLTLPGLGLSTNTALPLIRYLLIPSSLAVMGTALWGAWRQRTVASVLLAGWMLLAFPIGFHDLAMQSYRGDLESIYLTPYVYVGLFTMFLVIAYSRYVQALNAQAEAKTTLQQRLTERERELAQSHERLRKVEREQTLLAERQRLMREMHDGVGSSLMTALRMVEHGSAERVNVPQVLRECIDDLKISIDSLEPVNADLLALLAGLRFRLAPRLEGAGLTLDWEVQELPPLPWLDAQSGLHILRTLQEVLTNILKHSGARHITLSTACEDEAGVPGVVVRVSDDGHPFRAPPPETLVTGRKGLSNIHARAAALGGRASWLPGVGRGTEFRLWLPLKKRMAMGAVI